MLLPSDLRYQVVVRPRLHLTLIGMNAAGYRRNGGIGFSISEPTATISASPSSTPSIQDIRRWPLQGTEISNLSKALERLGLPPVNLKISGDMPSHCGFGSATAIRLASVEALGLLYSKPLERHELVRVSGRGGTSGIGVSTYFEGGLVFDVGVCSGIDFAPSSLIESIRSAPLVLSRFPMPNWKIGICIPTTLTPQSFDEEAAFFKRVCPLPDAAVNETLYHVIYGLVAGARELQFSTFCKATRAIQKGGTGFVWRGHAENRRNNLRSWSLCRGFV